MSSDSDETDSDATGSDIELQERREQARPQGTDERVELQHGRGKLTAYERLETLLDDGSFREFDRFVEHRCTNFGMDERTALGDAVVTGYGTIDGRTVAVYAHDFTFLGGSVSEVVANKVCKVIDWAIENGMPVIGLNDSGGARIQEGLDALTGFARIFAKHTEASGLVPQVSVIMGPCAGGATYAPALTDFVFMVEDTAYAFITGPDVVEEVTGEQVSKAELGGAETHTLLSGFAHGKAPSEEAVLEAVRRVIGYLPANCGDSPPKVDSTDDPRRETPELDRIVPSELSKPYDVTRVVAAIVDEESLFEVHTGWARNLITGFAHLDGTPVGIMANQPRIKAGTLDISTAQKGARFVRFCDAFNLPVVTLVDVPGFMPGTEQEYGGVIRHGAKLIHAYAEATVPLVTVVTRKAYGGAYIVMGSKFLGADVNYAWPEAEMAVLGPRPAVRILYKREIAQAEDPDARREELMDEFRSHFANPYGAAKRGYIDDVIEPSETRWRLIDDLAALNHHPPRYPEKTHGNIPL